MKQGLIKFFIQESRTTLFINGYALLSLVHGIVLGIAYLFLVVCLINAARYFYILHGYFRNI